MPQTMKVMTIAVELKNIDGQLCFPLSDPIPWNIAINEVAEQILVSQPEVLNSLIFAIRGVVGYQGE